jgi:Methyltransferase domain
MDVDERIASLDLSLFDAVPSQTYPEDRKSLLLIQRCVRRSGSYTYLEIGSHLGGTLQPHLLDGQCALIYSIDKRPLEQADEAIGTYHYPENSTQRMLNGLQEAFPQSPLHKIRTFDCDARELNQSEFSVKPDFCFIDGEHTDEAVFSDFQSCLAVCKPDGIIGFHDANIIAGGLARIKQQLAKSGTRFQGFVIPRHVYVILLNRAIEMFGEEIKATSQDESSYMRNVRWDLLKRRISRRYPGMQRIWHACRRLVSGGNKQTTYH